MIVALCPGLNNNDDVLDHLDSNFDCHVSAGLCSPMLNLLIVYNSH